MVKQPKHVMVWAFGLLTILFVHFVGRLATTITIWGYSNENERRAEHCPDLRNFFENFSYPLAVLLTAWVWEYYLQTGNSKNDSILLESRSMLVI